MSYEQELFLYYQNWILCIVFNYTFFCLVLGRFISVPSAPQVEDADPYQLEC